VALSWMKAISVRSPTLIEDFIPVEDELLSLLSTICFVAVLYFREQTV